MPNCLEDAARVAHELRPDYLQIHSNFTAEQLEKLKELAGAKIIGVVAIPQKIGDEGAILNRAREVSKAADYVLLDTKGPAGGGTGLTHDWNFSRKIRESLDKPVFLAGGLNPSNVREAIKVVRPHGVDVASGVESSPGKKDPKLMRAFIKAAREM
jgi:phosphoribosylanthranilate isomerase